MFNLLRSNGFIPSMGRDARREKRHSTAATISLSCDQLGWVDAQLLDLSAHGGRISVAVEFARDMPITLAIEGMPLLDARIIWSRGHEAGICFYSALHEAVLQHILAKSGARRI